MAKTSTMMAAVLHGPRDLRLRDVPVPEPAPDEVLVRISTNGLCGSDIHFFEDGKLGPYVVDRPYIPGHEASGTVVRAASAGGGPAEGTRVAVEPGIPCRRCRHCKGGRYNLCEDVVFLSAPPVNGTFAEYVAIAADFAHPVPDSVSDEEAAFIEPVSVGIQAANRAGFTAGSTAAILGAGPIGLVTMLVLKAYGASEVFAVDVLEGRLALAERLGAAGIVNPRETDPAAAVAALTGGRGADFVFDTSGSSAACASAPGIAARGGVVTLVGWPETASVPFPVELVLEKELDVRGVNRYCNTYPTAVGLISARKIDVSPLVSHRFAFRNVVEAFVFASEHREQTVKVMIAAERD